MTGLRHFAVIAPPTPGHVNPLQVLGSALMDLGHRVTIVHQPDVAPLITDPRVGFTAIPDVTDVERSLRRFNATLAAPTGPVGLTRMIRATAAISERLLDQAPSVLRRIGADTVIADSAEPAGALIAQTLGLPMIVSVTGLPLLGEEGVPPPFLGWRYRDDAIGRFRNRGGYRVSERLMRPVADVLNRHRAAWDLPGAVPAPRLYVAQCPQALDYPRRNLPPQFRYGAPWRSPADESVELPDDGRPLVFCSLGSLQGARRSLFALMAQACAAIGARAVIGHGGGLSAAEAAGLPGDPLVRAMWPQQAVLRHAAAAILHGGFNTVLDALAAGIPIVALPIAFEQPGTAARVAWTGAGEVLSPRTASVRRLALALERVIGQSCYREAASRLAAGINAAGGASSAAAAIDAALN
ncbi:glycosyltransferase [Sphingomonas cynarae]|uniref:Glycosyltransferase n=1 Tax=Sphingomonas cynarae TaxID=930197 RepID=A0ABP7E888_9SPHN